jgi:hypothetical protein
VFRAQTVRLELVARERAGKRAPLVLDRLEIDDERAREWRLDELH